MSPDAEAVATVDDTVSVDAAVSIDDTAAHARWEAALADLETSLGDATTTPWSEPTGLGPVPRELVGRASRLLAAQRDRIAAVEDARRVTLEHLAALRAVDGTRTPQAAVYLDASA
ncbi:hypothetical protein [Curtobacterium herbarum]|uniref:hypothetical protein n=1 Tax=Curtobacterium herbarum TaxID=150122 RepID=UPI00195DB73E|nr:hypothetical protein [Curtobacterium herbarum]MBM7475551.1 hypothetical protein [Curtobacterium herbarum]MCS6543465.1 hypothetical protein [Curtobacterium herbarum]